MFLVKSCKALSAEEKLQLVHMQGVSHPFDTEEVHIVPEPSNLVCRKYWKIFEIPHFTENDDQRIIL